MRLVGPALKDERLSSAAPGAERASSSSGLALLSSPPGEERDRSTRPVAILRIARFWPSGHRATPITNPAAGLDGLEAFGSEFPVSTDTRQAASTPGSSSLAATSALPKRAVVAGKWIAVALLGASLTAAAFLVYQRRVAAKPTTGVLSVETVPTGLEVSVAGKVVGKTPLAVALPAGSYDVQIGQVPNQRVLKLALGAGATVMQHVEMPAPPAPAIESGSLRILTEPAKLPVLIDGVERGLSPLTVDQIQSGDHEVSVRSPGGALHRTRDRATAGNGVADRFVGDRADRQEHRQRRVVERVVAGAVATARERQGHRIDRVGSGDAAGRRAHAHARQ